MKQQFYSYPPGAFPSEFLFQHVNDHASRIQSESSISGFVEAPPIMERSSMSDFVFSTLVVATCLHRQN